MSGKQLSRLPTRYRRVELSPDGPVLMACSLPDLAGQNVVVIRPLMAGICRSDIREVQGVRPLRRDFGHEVVGTVEWSGESVDLKRGDLVSLDPNVPINRTPAFGELLVASGNPTELALAFPKVRRTISLKKLVMCEPLACARHCVSNLYRHLAVSELTGLRVGIVGAGNAGTFIAMILKYLGAKITLFNRGFDRLGFLRRHRLFAADELEVLGSSRMNSFDAVVPTTSFLYLDVLDFALKIVKPGGLLLLYGGTSKSSALPGIALEIDSIRRCESSLPVSWRGKSVRIAGTYGALRSDFSAVLDYLDRDPAAFPVERMITQEVALEDLPAIFRSLTAQEARYIGKVIVILDGKENQLERKSTR